MEPNWAVENLQTIRTLMERSAVYRRTLAPIMLVTGGLGLLAALLGYATGCNDTQSFGLLWLVTAAIALGGAAFIVRRQAAQAAEPFWTPPARRVVQALLPAWLAALCLTVPPVVGNAGAGSDPAIVLMWELLITVIWILFYGLGLHAAGFFVPRGIKVFGWIGIAGAVGLACSVQWLLKNFYVNTNVLMGLFFGGLHLAYGGYLWFTEKRKRQP